MPRPSSPRARIMRSTRSMIRAAHTSASLRADGGVVPACESWPVATASYQTIACAPVTMPICFASLSRIGPCSICSSKYASAGKCGRRLRAAIADPVERGPHRHALHVGQRIGLVEREHARPDPRPHQRMAEPAALLVGPVHQLERRLGDDAEVVQRVHDLQPGQHAQRAVEFSAATAGCRDGCRTAPAGGPDRARRGGRTCCRSRRPARQARRPRTRRGTARGRAGPLRSASAAARRPSAWRRSPPCSSGCPTAACRRCADWSERSCRASSRGGAASCPPAALLQERRDGAGVA